MTILKRLFRSREAEPDIDVVIARGDEAREAQDWLTAAAAYEEALALEPSMKAIRVQYAHMLKESGRVSDAVEEYRLVAVETPENADVRVHLAHALKRLERTDEAIAMFREAIELNPSDRESTDEIFRLSQKQVVAAARPEACNAPGDPAATTTLEELFQSVSEGVSVVTCARNRTENLLRALPSWLAYDEVSEVIIVDWTSREPVHFALKEAGFDDLRIKVVRIEGEPRWILSTAFNARFRAATHDKILKVDADIVLKDGFFDQNPLEDGAFIAGNWRDAEPGQEFINGFFFARRSDLLGVNGFNELITTYGWDDDDLYDRLQASGFRRVSVKVETITHLPHDDAARLETEINDCESAHVQYWNQTSTKISANRFMCFLMPTWGKSFQLQPFAVEAHDDGLFVGRRSAPPPATVPYQVRRDAERYTVAEFLSTKVGRLAYELTPEEIDQLMNASSLDAVTPLTITLAAKRPDRLARNGNYLVVRLVDDAKWDDAIVLPALSEMDAQMAAIEFGLVVVDGAADVLNKRFGNRTTVPFLSYASGSAVISADDLAHLGDVEVGPGECREIYLDRALAPPQSPTSPNLPTQRDTLYIDAQHGLGNRLRAIASAASIAKKTDRDLVIVWEPDHHCECDLRDLFDYSGHVIQKAFVKDARDSGLATFNYMEIEEGSDRGAPLILEQGLSAYARSAYVLNHPFSDWNAENEFLRNLTPTKAIMDLVDSVPYPSDVSVHVRMEAAPGTELHSYDSPENWPDADHVTLQKWRAKSHFSNFMARLDQTIEANEVETIFLAADMPETYAVFAETYGDRVRYLERTLYDRSREQMYYALADAILLSKSKSMLGSNWSSFSEIALRLSTSFDRIQLSGEDF